MSDLKFFNESSIRNLEICITSISILVRDGRLAPEAAMCKLRDARRDLFTIYWSLSRLVVAAESELKKHLS